MQTVVFILYAGIVALASLRPGIDGGNEHLDKVTHLLVYYLLGAQQAWRGLPTTLVTPVTRIRGQLQRYEVKTVLPR